MNDTAPDMETWQQLYAAAIQVKEMAPWAWMEETDVFGIQDPETGDLGFVSVMGSLGEYLSVALYLGAEGLSGFWMLQEVGPAMRPEDIFHTPQLQASFEDRSELTDQDRAVIKSLGLKFRGRQAWPQFRSFRPGYRPWYLEAHEARFLTRALEQVLEMAPRFRADPTVLQPEGDKDNDYLVRVAEEEGGQITWHDTIMTVAPPEPSVLPLPRDAVAAERLRSLPQSDLIIEMDLFILPTGIGERGERPRFAYCLLTVEHESGFVWATDILTADPTLEAMYASVPNKIIDHLLHVGERPITVWVTSEPFLDLAHLVAEDVGFEVAYVPMLPQLEAAKESLLDYLG